MANCCITVQQHTQYQTSAQREHDKIVTVVVRSMFIAQRKIVSNIFNCNLIICSENIEKMYSDKPLKTAYLTWQIIFQKWKSLLIVNSESLWKIVNPTAILFWVYNWNMKKATQTFFFTLFLTNIVDVRVLHMCVKS